MGASKADGLKGEGGQKGGLRDGGVGSQNGRGGKGGGQKFRFFFFLPFPSSTWIFFLFAAVQEGAFPLQGDSQDEQRTSNVHFRVANFFWREGNFGKF